MPALRQRALVYRVGSALALGILPIAASASCPDFTAPAGVKDRIQFPGPCPASTPFIHPVIDLGIAVVNLPEKQDSTPFVIGPGDCVWIEKRWVPCLRSRCIATSPAVEPLAWTPSRGLAPTPAGAKCTKVWGSP